MNKITIQIYVEFSDIFKEREKKYGAHSHVRATARLEEHIIHSRGQRYVVPLNHHNNFNR